MNITNEQPPDRKKYRREPLGQQYSLKIFNGRVKIYINGYVFLSFNQIDFKGYYAFKEDTDWYGIDVYLKDTIIKTSFETKATWLAVLKIMDERL